MVQVVTFSCTLSNTGEHGITAVLCRDITDQLLDQYGLTYTRTAEKSDLTTLLVRAQQVNDLDTRLQKFRLRSLLLEFRCRSVDRLIEYVRGRLDIVDRLSQNVEDTSQCIFTDRNRDRSACRNRIHTSHESVGRTHSDTSYRIVTQML